MTLVSFSQSNNRTRDGTARVIYNGNWTSCHAIWSEIIRVISKSNERVALVRFEITSMISDQNCMTRSSIATLLDPFWNRTIFGEKQDNKVLATVVAKFTTKWFCAFHFLEILLITLIEHWILIDCFVLLSHSNWVPFEITSMISDQNCMTRSSIATLLDPFWNRTSFGNSSCKILHTMTFWLSFSWNFIDYFKRTLESDWLFCFTFPF